MLQPINLIISEDSSHHKQFTAYVDIMFTHYTKPHKGMGNLYRHQYQLKSQTLNHI